MSLTNFNQPLGKAIRQQGLSAGIAAIMLVFPAVSEATNGYFAHGYGARSKAMAGVGAALPQDAMAAAVNPAGMVFVGNRLDVEMELFNPNREYTVQGAPSMAPGAFPLNPGTVKSDSDLFPIPTLGWNHKLDRNQSIGLTVFGNGGMNTDYPGFTSQTCAPGGTGTFCGGSTGIDLVQLFISPSYARSFANNRFSVGIAPIFAVQSFKAQGLSSFAGYSSDSQNLSNNIRNYSYGAGVRVGGIAELLPGLHLGVSYKSRVFMSPSVIMRDSLPNRATSTFRKALMEDWRGTSMTASPPLSMWSIFVTAVSIRWGIPFYPICKQPNLAKPMAQASAGRT